MNIFGAILESACLSTHLFLRLSVSLSIHIDSFVSLTAPVLLLLLVGYFRLFTGTTGCPSE